MYDDFNLRLIPLHIHKAVQWNKHAQMSMTYSCNKYLGFDVKGFCKDPSNQNVAQLMLLAESTLQ